MEWFAYCIAGASLVALVVIVIRHRSRATPGGQATDTPTVNQVPDLLSSLDARVSQVLLAVELKDPEPPSLQQILAEFGDHAIDLDDCDVVVQPVNEGHVVVYGSQYQARNMGTVLGSAPAMLTRAARHAGQAVEAGVETAKQTGFLVELSPESAKAWKELNKISDKSGYVLGVFRDGDKKFRHVVKLKKASKVKALASGTAVLSALAAQAQLDEIERQLGQISRDIHDVHDVMEDRREAELLGAMRLLQEVYSASREANALTPAMWAQIAPLAHAVYTLQEESRLRLGRVLKKVGELSGGARQRADELDALLQNARRALRLVIDEERAVVQFQLLRIWHLTTTADPSLRHTLQQLEVDSQRRRELMVELSESVAAALENPDVKGGLQRIRIWTRRDIRDTAKTLQELVETRTTGLVELPMIERPSIEG